MPPFWTPWRPRKKEAEPEPLPLVQRMDTLEADMLGLRAAIDSVQGTVRKLSGKVYRGVQLGETVDAASEADIATEQGPPDPYQMKRDLYARAAALRSKH